jgi:PAS domain S-box-containing protein
MKRERSAPGVDELEARIAALEQARERAEQELAVRERVAEIFLGSPDDDDVYSQVLALARGATASELGTFGYFDERARFVTPAITREAYWDACAVADKGGFLARGSFGGIWGRAIAERRTQIDNAGPFRLPDGHVPIRNTMVTPVLHRGELVSALHVANCPGGYGEEEQATLELLAAIVAPVLHARLQRQRRERERDRAEAEMHALLRATRAIVEKGDFEKAAGEVFRACRDLIGAPAGYVALLDDTSARVVVNDCGGLPCTVKATAPIHVRGLRAKACAGQRAVYDNALAVGRLPAGHIPLENALFAPLRVNGEVLGLCSLANKPGGFDEHDARLIEAFAELCAISLRDHRREAALRSSEQDFRHVFEDLADGIALTDPETRRLVLVNRAMCAMLGRPEAELRDLPCSEIVAPDAVPELAAAFDRVSRGERCLIEGVQVRRLDGSMLVADVSAAPATVLGRSLVLASFRDVTENRQLRASLAQSDRLANMGLIAAGVAHEINNPLAYALMNLESVADELPQLAGALRRLPALELDPALRPAPFEDLLERVREALEGTRRIKEVVRGLGTFSRIEESEAAPVDLHHPIAHAISMARNEIRYRARLVQDLQPVPPVLASDGKLAQVFLNLIINAAHAIDEGDVERNQILIRTWSEGGRVLAEVSDTGHGIPEEHRARIFEPFFTTKGIGMGSGLGLAICRNIVHGLGGELRFQSTLGQGTCFVVDLPPLPGNWGSGGPPATASATPATRGRILVVDDERGIRAAVTRLLGRDHEVVSAASGEEAKLLLERDQRFDLLFFDLMMPELSGMELYAWLKEQNAALADQVVFITGGAFTPRARQFLSGVENLRVEKPFDVTSFKKMAGELVLAARAKRGG